MALKIHGGEDGWWKWKERSGFGCPLHILLFDPYVTPVKSKLI